MLKNDENVLYHTVESPYFKFALPSIFSRIKIFYNKEFFYEYII